MKGIPKSRPTLGSHEVNRYGKNDLELLEREDVDCIEVSQVICKPFMMLRMGENTVHKGIRNSTNEDRPLFFCCYSTNAEYKFNEDPVETHAKITGKLKV